MLLLNFSEPVDLETWNSTGITTLSRPDDAAAARADSYSYSFGGDDAALGFEYPASYSFGDSAGGCSLDGVAYTRRTR